MKLILTKKEANTANLKSVSDSLLEIGFSIIDSFPDGNTYIIILEY